MKNNLINENAIILHQHLEDRSKGIVSKDISRFYAEDILLLTSYGVFYGHTGIEYLAALLSKQLKNPTFEYYKVLVEKNIGFLEWKADGENAYVLDGADSYVFKNGLFVAQTIHYTLKKK